MRRITLLAIPAALGLGLDVGSAAAECAMPGPALFPDAEVLPPNPVLYRFELAWTEPAALRVEGASGPVPFTVTDVSATDAVRVQEIRVAATNGSFTVHGGAYETPATYRIDPGWTRPAKAPAVEGVSWVEDAWTCSHSVGLVIEARGQGVVAFRAEWNGGGASAIVPPNDGYFWRMMGGERDPAALRAFLGHPSCVANLIPQHLIGRKDVRLHARYADGSEVEVELPRAAAETQMEPRTKTQPQTEREPESPGGATWRIAMGMLVGLAALVSISTLFVARRRRRNAMIVP